MKCPKCDGKNLEFIGYTDEINNEGDIYRCKDCSYENCEDLFWEAESDDDSGSL